MNHKQLTFAREYRGYSQTQLSNMIEGLSQSNLSKFEKGFGVLSKEIQTKIIDFLDFPSDFFEIRLDYKIENANYRKRTTINKSEIQSIERKSFLTAYIIDQFSESIEWPEFKLKPLDIELGFDPKYVANYTRKLLNLSQDMPVRDINGILESNGIIIYEIDEIDKFDGVSFTTDNGVTIIIINKNYSNDRKRFTLAHELGHILMHNEFPISSFRDKENEANIFASEFLMPENEIRNALRGLKLSDIGQLKHKWLTSMASIIRRARDLNCIDDNRYKFFMIEMSRNGFTKKEPIEVHIDQPTCFKNAYQIFKDVLNYSIDDFVQSLSLPKDIINEILCFDNNVKLKIVK